MENKNWILCTEAICSRYTPSHHTACSLICMFQENASGCHVKNSNKSESKHAEMGETPGIAQKEVLEAE